jgi:hypothetical protein
MANGSSSGIMIMMFGVLMLGGVGLYMMTRNKSSPGPSDIQLDVSKDASGAIKVTGTNTDLGNIGFTPSRSIYTTEFTEGGKGVPITGGSTRRGSPYRFDELALGTCQCDYDRCCYKTIYQPRRGEPRTEKECRDVYYGDVVDACERAVKAAEANTFRSVISARTRKYAAQAVKARMGRIYS